MIRLSGRRTALNPYVRRAGLEYVSWRLRAFDTRVQKPEVIARRILNRATSGNIILLHDGSGAGTRVMLRVLPGIIAALKARRFNFVLAG